MKKKAYVLLDRSGSMEGVWEDTLSGINSYVKEIGDAEVVLAAFDTQSYDVLRNTTTDKWVPVTRRDVFPRSTTPLLDAAGRILWDMKDSGADRAVLVVVTDGFENSSVKFKASEIKSLVSELTTKNKYEVVFLGANFDGIADVARNTFGVADMGKFMASSASAQGISASYDTTATASAGYFNTGASMNYSDSDKAAAKAK